MPEKAKQKMKRPQQLNFTSNYIGDFSQSLYSYHWFYYPQKEGLGCDGPILEACLGLTIALRVRAGTCWGPFPCHGLTLDWQRHVAPPSSHSLLGRPQV